MTKEARTDAGWWVSGGLLAVLLLVVGYAVVTDSSGEAGTPTAPGQLGPAPNVDLSSMTAREAADNLFNRVMQAFAAEDTVEAGNFLPMAVDAYELARPLDEDGHFHLALLQRASGDSEASRETALQGLEIHPDHLLNLSAAAEASRDLGDDEAARRHYARMLEVWDEELATDRPDYVEHERLLPLIREDAELLLEGSS